MIQNNTPIHICTLAAAFVVAPQFGCSRSANLEKLSQQSTANFSADQTEDEPMSDLNRIDAVHAIAGLVEEFKDKTGHYPYEEAFLNSESEYVAVTAIVNITRKDLPEKYQYPPPGISGKVYSYNDFSFYLKETLGREIALPSDTEAVPRFFQYQFDGNHFYVSGMLLKPTEDTRQLAPKWNKYQVSSTAVPEKNILRFSDIKQVE